MRDRRERDRVQGMGSMVKAGTKEVDSAIQEVKEKPKEGQSIEQKEERSYVQRDDGH